MNTTFTLTPTAEMDAAVLAMLIDGDAALGVDSARRWRASTPVADLTVAAAYDAAARREQLSLAWDMAQGDDHAERSVLADAAEYDALHGLTGRVGSLYAELVADTLAVAA